MVFYAASNIIKGRGKIMMCSTISAFAICMYQATLFSMCPFPIAGENIWQLTGGLYCITSKIDSEISAIDTILKSDIDSVSTKVDSVGSQIAYMQSDLDACCSTLSTLDTIIKSDVDSVSSTLDEFVYCILGTQITQDMMPYTISIPGLYYLCESVTASGAPAITLASNDITFNLNGFTISNTTDSNVGFAASGTFSNVIVENGSLNIQSYPFFLGGITNFTIRNMNINNISDVSVINGCPNLIIENCYFNGNGTALGSLQSDTITGRLENVYMYNVAGTACTISGSNVQTLELINCIADTAGNTGFIVESSATAFSGVVFRHCVAAQCSRGYFINGTHILDNCIASKGGFGFALYGAQNSIFRNCLSDANSNDGFYIQISNNVVFSGCISSNNATSGYMIDTTFGASNNCNFDHCLSTDNTFTGFDISGSNNTVLSYCIASGNDIGIYDPVGSSNNFIINCQSEHAATAVNPAYNLNTNPDDLSGADTVIIIS